MLRVTSARTLSPSNYSRREWLRIGGLAPLGLSLASWLRQTRKASAAPAARPAKPVPSFGRAKRCVILWMAGGPAQQDTFDLKPDAPTDYRSAFRPIATRAPGIEICEHFPHLAEQMDKIALVRSVTHKDNNHSTAAHWMSTGYAHRVSQENFVASRRDHPHVGSVLAKLRPGEHALPTYVNLPERSHNDNGALTPGQDGGFLGAKHDPFWIEEHPHERGFEVPSLKLDDALSKHRLEQRASLLRRLSVPRAGIHWASQVEGTDQFFEQALDLLSTSAAQRAFDLSREAEQTRAAYGNWAFGQSLLLTRRLIEAGVPLVTVNWPRHRDSRIFQHWDTHANGFHVLKEQLIPWADRPVAVFLEDLNQRGLLDETLVVWMSEFGRSPAGQHGGHWASVNTIWFAGAGVSGGQVYGASDRVAAYPAENPVAPSDVTATLFHLLGLPLRREIHDSLGRPFPLSTGTPLPLF